MYKELDRETMTAEEAEAYLDCMCQTLAVRNV